MMAGLPDSLVAGQCFGTGIAGLNLPREPRRHTACCVKTFLTENGFYFHSIESMARLRVLKVKASMATSRQ